jgi:hypothetical protein
MIYSVPCLPRGGKTKTPRGSAYADANWPSASTAPERPNRRFGAFSACEEIDMYENLIRETDGLYDLLRGTDPALYHRGDCGRVLNYHRQHIQRAAHGAPLPPPAPYLFQRMSDTRSLRGAVDALVRDGPKAPGRDRVRLEDLDDAERWAMCRRLHEDLADGSYLPGPVLTRPVPKEGQPGEHRQITLLCGRDRVVAKSLAMFVSPMAEQVFSPFSFGFRPEQSPWTALACALAMASRVGRWVWVQSDLDHAFDRMPAQPAIDACRRIVTEDVAKLIRLISFDGKKGTPQGSPWSPLLFNIFADRYLDQPWHRRNPGWPLFRFADDLLVMAGSHQEAGALLETLARLARSAGVPLKPSKTAVADLSAGSAVEWLGYHVRGPGPTPSIRITERAWQTLSLNLTKCHLHDLAPLRAEHVVRGWLQYLGPCYPHEQIDGVLKRVRGNAASHAFDELPSVDSLHEIWLDAYCRWEAVQQEEAAGLDYRLTYLNERRSNQPAC